MSVQCDCCRKTIDGDVFCGDCASHDECDDHSECVDPDQVVTRDELAAEALEWARGRQLLGRLSPEAVVAFEEFVQHVEAA